MPSSTTNQSLNSNRRLRPLRLNADGREGTGKSFEVMLTSERLVSRAMGRGYPRSDVIVVRAAPTCVTGVAANGILGVTIHSLLRLPIGTKMAELHSHDIAALQNRPSGLRCLIIDEKSIISLKTLALIDGRLRQALTKKQKQNTKNISIILMGDFYQLP